MSVSDKISAGRGLVEAYRIAHRKLYDKEWHKGIPEEHTPLLRTMEAGLDAEGFKDLTDFFTQSKALEDGWE